MTFEDVIFQYTLQYSYGVHFLNIINHSSLEGVVATLLLYALLIIHHRTEEP